MKSNLYVPPFHVEVYMEFSIDCFLPCAFYFEVVSSLTSLFDLHPKFPGYLSRVSPSSTS
jgi:hypothetical protein